MDLSTYIADPSRRDALVKTTQANPQYLWQVANSWRGKRASPELAIAIERATKGAVTRSELRPDIWPPCADAQEKQVA